MDNYKETNASKDGDSNAARDKKSSNTRKSTASETASLQSPTNTVVSSGGLASGHFQERVITVSNAPPVSLKRKDSGQWEIAQGSGGLVTCCDPVMSKDTSNIWMACFGPNVPLNQIGPPRSAIASSQINSLGLPINRPTLTQVRLSMLQDPQKDEDNLKQEVKEQMSLIGILRNYSKSNYSLNPVVIPDVDYNTYYGGISNGLLWPAFHNLSEYIVNEYNDQKVLKDHWLTYVRVNYSFALNAVRNSRPQDFLWIHDYHLMLTGLIIQSLDPYAEVGFFLHIPFQPPDDFFVKYKLVAEAVLRGILRFTKVGFQTHRDRKRFVEVVENRFTDAEIVYNDKIDKHVVTFEGFLSSLGVFPVSIKNEDFLKIADNKEIKDEAQKIKARIMGKRTGKMFFSVERFDYTKGIKEKLLAYRTYYQRHPDRIGKDVFLQVAVTNRRTVDTYRQYQDDCIEIGKKLNEEIVCKGDKGWKPLILQTDGLKRAPLIAHYLAMDIGVVTPCKDGMNLVVKEMMICNPKASLVLSCGAGVESQFSSAGLFSDSQKCYHRVPDFSNLDLFADVLYNAVVEDKFVAERHGLLLKNFILNNDIDQWSESFLDPSWRHDVIQVSKIKSLQGFYSLMLKTRAVRQEIARAVLRGRPIRQHYWISLKNAKICLEKSCQPGANQLILTATDASGGKASVNFDVSHEMHELEIDEQFLNYVQSEAYDNMEQFLLYLAKYYPGGSSSEYCTEVGKIAKLLTRGDHFRYFFADRDGTMCVFACSYPSSIQGAYSGVIQATFAQRCTQYAAIITTAPLRNIGILDVQVVPEGYFCYGASCGREWYINEKKSFKDDSISQTELNLLNKVADKIAAQFKKPEFTQFAWIGSGLQRHYGHITVAKQDTYKSVDENVSSTWFLLVSNLVKEVDPNSNALVIQDTETDIKIYLKSKSGQVFNKGHGLRLFAQQMKFSLGQGNILVCADSETDLPMLEEVLPLNPQNVYTIWVTQNEELQQKVIELCEKKNNQNYAFASHPLVLLGAMAMATVRETRIRPHVTLLFDFDD